MMCGQGLNTGILAVGMFGSKWDSRTTSGKENAAKPIVKVGRERHTKAKLRQSLACGLDSYLKLI